ncbi:MAG: hypothetical protein REH79_02975 [Spiroplasma sp.]|nr:hypothetical protein [Spiroplasma sp.]
MNLSRKNNFRLIKQSSVEIPCYFFGFFKSPGLAKYPNLPWINDDYQLIKTKNIKAIDCNKIANNLFLVGKKFNLFNNVNYFITMPLKNSSVSSLEKVVSQLIKLVDQHLGLKIKLINDAFIVEDYLKFWENRLTLKQRQVEISNKIVFKDKYYNFFDDQKIIIIDDVVSTGTSIAEIALSLKKFNQSMAFTALVYGSVYQWQKIYN